MIKYFLYVQIFIVFFYPLLIIIISYNYQIPQLPSCVLSLVNGVTDLANGDS